MTYKYYGFVLCCLVACTNVDKKLVDLPVAERLSAANIKNGQYISWKEHLIDDTALSGIPIKTDT